MNYFEKYVKYKNKYCKIKLLLGGGNDNFNLKKILQGLPGDKIFEFAGIIRLKIPDDIKEQIKNKLEEKNLEGFFDIYYLLNNKLKEMNLEKSFGIYYLLNNNNLIYNAVFYEGKIDDIIFNDDILNSFLNGSNFLQLETFDKGILSEDEEIKLNTILDLYADNYFDLRSKYDNNKHLVNNILLNLLTDQKKSLFIAFRCPFIIHYICLYLDETTLTDNNNNNNFLQNTLNNKLFINICIYLLYKKYKNLQYIYLIFKKLNKTLKEDKNFILKIIKLDPNIYYDLNEDLKKDVDIVYEACVNPDSIDPKQHYIIIDNIFYNGDKYNNLNSLLEEKLNQNINLITFLKEKLNQNTNTNLSDEIKNQIYKIENQITKINGQIDYLKESKY
jgi:hypothetical protein